MDHSFVVREAELLQLQRHFDAISQGTPALVMVEGDFGIGKTTLLRQAIGLARGRGMLVCEARGSDLEHHFAFGVARQLFEPVLSTMDSDTIAELRSEPCGPALDIILSQADDSTEVGLHVPYTVLHGLFSLVRRLALRVPLLIAVDDLPVADLPTIRFLHHLVRRLDGLPVMCLFTKRRGTRVPSPSLGAELSDNPRWVFLPLGALTERGIARVIAEWLGPPDPEFVAACASLTAGNPLLLTELVKTAATDGMEPSRTEVERLKTKAPIDVAIWLRNRLSTAWRHAVVVVDALALLGPDADLATLAATTGLSEHAVAVTIDSLRGFGVLTFGDAPEFAHPLVPIALRHSLALLAADPSMPVGSLSHPSMPGHAHGHSPTIGVPWTLETLRAAARLAMGAGQPRQALAFLRQALTMQLPPDERAELLVEIGNAEQLVEPSGAVRRLRTSIDSFDDPCHRAHLSAACARALVSTGRLPDAVDVLTGALDGLPSSAMAAQRVATDLLLITMLGPDPRTPELLHRFEGPLSENPFARPSIDALRIMRRAAAGDRDVPVKDSLPYDLYAADDWIPILFALMPMLWAENYTALERHCAEIEAAARERGSALLDLLASAMRGLARYRQGRVEGLAATMVAAVRRFPMTRASHILVELHLATYLEVALETGELDEVDEVLAGMMEYGTASSGMWCSTLLVAGRARLRTARGDLDGARADLLACGECLDGQGVVNPAALPWRARLADVMYAADDQAGAARLAAEEVDLARRWGRPWALGIALRTYGRIQPKSRGLPMLYESVEVLEGSDSQLELSHSLFELGANLRRGGRIRDARAVLSRAAAVAEQLGVAPALRRAQNELVSSGARPRRPRQFGPESLTDSERRVATMAASGLSNGEIARQLFVTARTVETHLTRTYRKLGIASRAQLAAMLSDVTG